jgi:hypothetical protein
VLAWNQGEGELGALRVGELGAERHGDGACASLRQEGEPRPQGREHDQEETPSAIGAQREFDELEPGTRRERA